MTIFRRRRGTRNGSGGAEPSPATAPPQGRPRVSLGDLDALTQENRESRDERRERRLVRVRHEAASHLGQEPAEPQPEPDGSEVEAPNGIPSVGPEDLTPGGLRGAILAHGCLHVRGLVDPGRVASLVEGIDRAFAARDAHARDDGAAEGNPYFEPFTLEGRNLAIERQWVIEAGGVWAADSPPMLYELTEAFGQTGLSELVAAYLGERAALSVNKCTLRKVAAGGGSAWHQDGAFLGEEIRALNVWLCLSDCGEDAPGLDIVPRRLDGVVEAGTEGARFPWSVAPAVVERILEGAAPARPIFAPGDVLLFDQLMLHRTATDPAMTRERYAIETWCFAPSAYPEKQIPLAL